MVAPDYLIDELYKHRKYIAEKAGISEGEVGLLIDLSVRGIRIIPSAEYKKERDMAVRLIENDVGDATYVACCMALKCDGIWTNDPDYDGKKGIAYSGPNI